MQLLKLFVYPLFNDYNVYINRQMNEQINNIRLKGEWFDESGR